MTTHASSQPAVTETAVARIRALVLVALAVSVVHYVDNVANYADYPDPGDAPAPSRAVIAVSWFVFTAAALLALRALRERRWGAAAALLAAYSVSGLVGIGHYTVAGAFDMPWWRQLHVGVDIACGIALLASAAWLWRATRAQGGEFRSPAP